MNYILNGVNWQTLIMMLNDAPRFIDRPRKDDSRTAEEEATDIVGFFQSKL
nr:MAG TPA: hypothetical protein [Caudoviricetes sp.]